MFSGQKEYMLRNRCFWVSGVSFYTDTCMDVEVNDILDMNLEKDNEYDSEAIKITTDNNNTCGYVPKGLKGVVRNKLNSHELKVIEKKLYKGNYALRVMPVIRDKDHILVFDLETTGLPTTKGFRKYYSYKDTQKYDSSRTVQISFLLHHIKKNKTIEYDYIVKPDNFVIENSEFHGITQEMALNDGVDLYNVADILENIIDNNNITQLIGHNVFFDIHVLLSDLYRIGRKNLIKKIKQLTPFCTMEQSKNILKLKPCKYGKYKMPKLIELCEYVLGKSPTDLHNSLNDTRYTLQCYLKLFTNDDDMVSDDNLDELEKEFEDEIMGK